MSHTFANITLLTGIPRSGTTLLCSLLDRQANVIVAAEPGGVLLHTEATTAEQLEWCLSQIKKWRKQVQTEGAVFTRHVDGAIPENWLKIQNETSSIRDNKSELGYLRVPDSHP